MTEPHIQFFEEETAEGLLIQRFLRVREVTERICAPLSQEDYLLSVTDDTSPVKWHLAHTSWFFEHFLLKPHHRGYLPFHDHYEFIFNSYYKSAGSFIPKVKRHILSRPPVEEIYRYRHHVTTKIQELFKNLPERERLTLFQILELGINHEEQHQELILMDIKRNFYESPLKPQYMDSSFAYSPLFVESKWKYMSEGLVSLGVPLDSKSFAFDNEKDQHSCWVESFSLSSHLVTNGEFMQFIEDGGYQNPLLWLSDGWDFKEKENWQAPLYWENRDGQWWHMTLSGMSPIDESAPVVHISYYEAKAYAHWKKARLPKESEWEMASRLESTQGEFLEDGVYQPEATLNNHDAFSQIHGTVWEWTESAYLPYPRYQALENGLAEYNEKFMCNQMVLRGGSCVTPIDHYRPTYRNFYYPHMRWQFAGLRLAKDGIQ